MAVPKAIRSNPLAQPTRRRPNSQPRDPHLKAEIFDTLRQLNRGYGIALAALDRLGGRSKKDRLGGGKKHRLHQPRIFSAGCLRDYHNRTEALRALANRDLLRFFTGHEEHDATHFGSLGRNRRS